MTTATVQNTPHSWGINGQTVTVLHPCEAHGGAFIVRMADDSTGCLYVSELSEVPADELRRIA